MGSAGPFTLAHEGLSTQADGGHPPGLPNLAGQLEALARTRSTVVAAQIFQRSGFLLEPAWEIVITDDTAREAFGLLRAIGESDLTAPAYWQNLSVMRAAAESAPGLRLTIAPPTRIVNTLQDPRRALLEAVGGGGNPEGERAAGEPNIGVVQPTPRPAVGNVMDPRHTDSQVAEQLRKLLRKWFDRTRRATSGERELAQLLLAAAFFARDAVIQGDIATVKWFLHAWLGYGRTSARVDGTCAALLEDGWFPRGVDEELSTARDEVAHLRAQVLYQHRLHRPVWETQIGGHLVGAMPELGTAHPALRESSDVSDELERATLWAAICSFAADSPYKLCVLKDLLDGRPKSHIQLDHCISRYSLNRFIDDFRRFIRDPHRPDPTYSYSLQQASWFLSL